jgi:hypothetical protein
MTKEKDKSKKSEATPARAKERIERREYGFVKVKTLRPGIVVEQLVPERPKKNRR